MPYSWSPGVPVTFSLSSVAHGRGSKGRNLAMVCVELVGEGGQALIMRGDAAERMLAGGIGRQEVKIESPDVFVPKSFAFTI
jgi:hypothetical protein